MDGDSKAENRVTWRLWRAVALCALLALVLAAPAGALAARPFDVDEPPDEQAAAEPRLPDLRTLPPEDLTIEFARGGRRMLRLANMVWNSGDGALELIGALNPSTQKTMVIQRLTVSEDEVEEHVVGEFVYHPLHAHFHVEAFAVYEVWSVTPDLELHHLMATGGKLSYCLMETHAIDRNNPFFVRSRVHTDCGQETQGMLPGWGDRYNADLPGQTVDITTLSNGVYALKSIANRSGALLESDYTNNAGMVVIEIRNTRVTVLSKPWPLLENCRATGRC